ncbi:MAG TPA: SusD/RagB family nutrient-binding outer membrane lipoprotein [Gemmatimonadaceae bacterium]
MKIINSSVRCTAALLLLVAVGACGDFLTGGELSTDPNRPTQATSTQLFIGVQSNIWSELESDPARITSMWAQQFTGTNFQYVNIYDYGVSEQTTNGFHASLYGGGGLVDIRKLEAQSAVNSDSLFLGIAQDQEALLMGTGADLFGDLVYSQALKGTPNPPLDPQLSVYDTVQAVLARALVNLAATGPTNFGPGPADLSYGGNASQWIKLAHTLKARFYLHTAEVRPGAYAQALTEAPLGITDPADNFVAVFSGNSNEQNFWYQFDFVDRAGYLTPNADFVALLKSRSDPRLSNYFNSTQSDISDVRLAPDFTQPLVTANEDLLIWSEAAYRTGDQATALAKLNAERALAGLPSEAPAGQALLAEILTEKYIADFETIEAWNDYKRTCSPNLVPVVAGKKIPARFLYDASERQTDSSIPLPTQQPTRNANDPANAVSDATGAACLGQ